MINDIISSDYNFTFMHFTHTLTEVILRKKILPQLILHSDTYKLLRDVNIIIGEKYIYTDKISRSIMIACTHVHILLNHMTYLISYSRETHLFCSYTRNSSQQKMFRIESLLSMNHPWTISIPESSSLAVSWPSHVSLLHDLIYVLCIVKALASFSLELAPLLAVLVESLMSKCPAIAL